VRTHSLCWLTALSLLATRPCDAQLPAAPDSISPCSEQIQLALTACANSAYRRADADLNRTYGRVLARVSAVDRAKLRTAQRAWLRFRDAQCTFEAAAYDGGSMQPMVKALCLESVTRARERQVSTPRSPNDEPS
jgi:uncharacterized protein YecT (DUF1311 family)